MGANPHANGGKLLVDLDLPDFTRLRASRRKTSDRAPRIHASTRQDAARHLHAERQAAELPAILPRRDQLEPAGQRLRGREPLLGRTPSSPIDDHLSPDGRVMEVLSEHLCQGWLEGYLLTGRHGLFATYEAFAMVVRVDDGAARQVAGGGRSSFPGASPSPSLNILLTSTCWRNDHNGFSHQGPGLIDTVLSKQGNDGAHLPAAGRQLPALGGRSLLAQSQLRQPDRHRQAAAAAMALDWTERLRTAPRRSRPGTGRAMIERVEPDVVLACAGDIPTLETVAAAWWLRQHLPELKVRVVNVVDLMRLFPPLLHPHGMDETTLHRAVHHRRAGRLRLPRLPASDPRDRARTAKRRSVSMCVASSKRVPRPRRLTWSYSTG